jgi:ATP-dependent Clp protease ATP-binding subunit ClpB
LLADRRMPCRSRRGPKARDPRKELVDPTARKLLAGELDDGAVISVTAGADGLEMGRAKVH